MPAHCSALIAEVPLSVSRSMSTSSAGMRNGFRCALRRINSRSAGVVSLIGSTILMRNGSMIVFMRTSRGGALGPSTGRGREFLSHAEQGDQSLIGHPFPGSELGQSHGRARAVAALGRGFDGGEIL